ncbi:MAG: winged helix-turn-helix transcriptional regulator [Gammaproteobacteria bacterium]|nr:winged helix-turn-helix transcriptional regulator [Gammaproteobacteria bacterium]MCP5199056.1 winged helix-turn-helix transcriptional regulator [Gammaproteobacteria bacterium]
MNIQDMEGRADEVAGLMKTLSHRTRLLLLCQLVDGEKSVGELAQRLGQAQPNVSQQLALLRREGLVQTRRDGQTIYYVLPSGRLSRLMGFLYDNFCD